MSIFLIANGIMRLIMINNKKKKTCILELRSQI